MKQHACTKCNRVHLGPCRQGGVHRRPSRLRTLSPTLAPPPSARPRRSGIPLLEAMGFADRDLPTPAPVLVAPPPPAPVRLAPALLPARTTQRPLPDRPAAGRPTTHTHPGTVAYVNALWNDHTPDPHEASLLPPKEMSFSRTRSGARTATVLVLAVAVVAAVAAVAWGRFRADERAAATRAETAATAAFAVSEELEAAAAFVTDPAASPSDLSAAAGTITRLSAASLDLLGVGRELFPARMGANDPVSDRSAFLAAGERASGLADAMSRLLTTRLVLEELIVLPHLTTVPDEAALVGADLATAVARARARLVDVPDSHATIADDASQTLDRIADRAATYITDLRNGAPVGGHLSAFEGEVAAFAGRLGVYLGDQVASLDDLTARYRATLAGL